MQNITDVLPSAGWALLGAAAAKLVSWALAYRSSESDRITKTYDAVNAAQKSLVDGLFQQVAQLRTELVEVRTEYRGLAERHQQALTEVENLRDEVQRLKAEVASRHPFAER